MLTIRVHFAIVVAVFCIVFWLPSSLSTSQFSEHRNSGVPSYLLQLYRKLLTGQSTLPPGVTEVHSFYAYIEKCHNKIPKQKTAVKVFSSFPGIHSAKKVAKATIHVHIGPGLMTSASYEDRVMAVCRLSIFDIKTRNEIISLRIPCYEPSVKIFKLTNLVKKWIHQPLTNSGIRIKITLHHAAPSRFTPPGTPVTPYVNTSSRLRKPFFILYARK